MNLSKKNQRVRAEIGKLYTERIGAEGLFLGYRRSTKRGSWVAKLKRPGDGFKYDFYQLGESDDTAWGFSVRKKLSYDRAIDAAMGQAKGIGTTGEIVPGAYTVKQAMADYLKASESHKGETLGRTRYVINRHINPHLGEPAFGLGKCFGLDRRADDP